MVRGIEPILIRKNLTKRRAFVIGVFFFAMIRPAFLRRATEFKAIL